MGWVVRTGFASRTEDVCATDKGIRLKRNHAGRFVQPYIGILLLTAASMLSGCSITDAVSSLGGDEDISTGSLRTAKTPLSDTLSVEDWRRAKAALAVALDPQGNGSPVRWDNPETKASGSFAASGAFTVRSNLVCRPFQATLSVNGVATSPLGIACRQGPGEWAIEENSPQAVHTQAGHTKASSRKAPRAGSIF